MQNVKDLGRHNLGALWAEKAAWVDMEVEKTAFQHMGERDEAEGREDQIMKRGPFCHHEGYMV